MGRRPTGPALQLTVADREQEAPARHHRAIPERALGERETTDFLVGGHRSEEPLVGVHERDASVLVVEHHERVATHRAHEHHVQEFSGPTSLPPPGPLVPSVRAIDPHFERARVRHDDAPVRESVSAGHAEELVQRIALERADLQHRLGVERKSTRT